MHRRTSNAACKANLLLNFLLLFLTACVFDTSSAASGSDVQYIEARMPEFQVLKEDAYLCTAITLPDEPLKLVGVEPLAKQEIAHHLLLFGKVYQLGPRTIGLLNLCQALCGSHAAYF